MMWRVILYARRLILSLLIVAVSTFIFVVKLPWLDGRQPKDTIIRKLFFLPFLSLKERPLKSFLYIMMSFWP